jgi:hypothetical protein
LEVVDILRRIVTAIEIHPRPERGKVDIKVTGVPAEILAIAHRKRAHGKRTKRTASPLRRPSARLCIRADAALGATCSYVRLRTVPACFPDNFDAIALYRRLGFRTRRHMFVLWHRPSAT